MLRNLKLFVVGIAVCTVLGAVPLATQAGTIVKLDLGTVAPDIEFETDTLSTYDDLIAGTNGNQNTAALFEGALESYAADITTAVASFTMDGLERSGQAAVVTGPSGSSVLQNFTGGTFSLWDASNTLLLKGDLAPSVLSGPIGHPSGALFTTSFGTFTGGTLKNHLVPNSLVLSMSFANVNSGGPAGFLVAPLDFSLTNPTFEVRFRDLVDFTANASIIIDGEERLIPEPVTVTLALMAAGLLCGSGRRRQPV